MYLSNKIRENASEISCYKCGVSEVTYVCHHCGQPMCVKHVFSAHNKKNKLLSDEFTKLKLSESSNKFTEEPYHCEQCIHIVQEKTWVPFIVAVSVLIFSLVAVPSSRLGVKILGFLTSAGLVGYGFYKNEKLKNEMRAFNPPLPVLPSFDKIKLQENLYGNIVLDSQGFYDVSTSPVQGLLDVSLMFSASDRQRLKDYENKYHGSAKKYHAGFVTLNGFSAVQFQNQLHRNTRVIPLLDQIINQPFLNGDNHRDSMKQHISLNYNLQNDPDDKAFPVQINISFLPETDQHGLEIAVQWVKPESNDFELWKELWKLEVEQIESLKLSYPGNWGLVENCKPNDNFVRGSLGNPTFSWSRIKILKGNRVQDRYIFSVQFENRIDSLASFIEGEIKVIFKGTLSGVDGVKIYYPSGDENKSEMLSRKSTMKTEVSASIKLHLDSLQYQKIRQVPDESNEGDHQRSETLFFQNVNPNYLSVTKLVYAISERGFYVKQLIENQPITHATTGKVSHSWTILGRWYEGVYPIDFYMNLRGQEESNFEGIFSPGNTTIKLTVKGTYSNPKMENVIVQVWDNLNEIRVMVMQQLISFSSYSEQPLYLPSSYEEDPMQIEARIVEDKDDMY